MFPRQVLLGLLASVLWPRIREMEVNLENLRMSRRSDCTKKGAKGQ
jgi:hypothetical protein